MRAPDLILRVKNFRNITQPRQPRDSNGLVIHVSSLNDRSTEVVMTDTVRIGTGDDCDVKIRLAQTSTNETNGTLIEVKRVDGTYRITSVDQGLDIKLNGRSIKPNKIINDGDEIWIGPSGPSIHFFPIAATTAMVPGRRGSTHVAPFIEQAAMEASATARRDDAKIFLREFTRELVREINPSTKIIPSLSLPSPARFISASHNSMRPGAVGESSPNNRHNSRRSKNNSNTRTIY